jgi:deoxycytidylate deaminase
MPKITENHIEAALHMSKKSPVQKKFGALLIYRGKIISAGYNYYNNGITNNATQCILRS